MATSSRYLSSPRRLSCVAAGRSNRGIAVAAASASAGTEDVASGRIETDVVRVDPIPRLEPKADSNPSLEWPMVSRDLEERPPARKHMKRRLTLSGLYGWGILGGLVRGGLCW